KKVFATLLVGMLAVFSFAAFEVTGGYVNASLATAQNGGTYVTMQGISVGANYLYDGLGVEGGALLGGVSFDYYFPEEFINNLTETTEITQMSLGVNAGYRQSLNAFFPDLPFGMYAQGLFNYSLGLGDPKVVASSLGFGGGAGASFAVQNLDMNVGADVLFEKPTVAEAYDEAYQSEFQVRPKFKVYAGVQF
ncbi:MAG: outer membrane beta-barrel protein, partial [Thermotogota bacterium]|nr:outer membrane beta-barrel protein [Thermotogota bacterium]